MRLREHQTTRNKSAAPQGHSEMKRSRLPISPLAMCTPANLQSKLTVNPSGDQYEQEADRVADQVMRMPEPKIQRVCPECIQRQKNAEEAEFTVHRKQKPPHAIQENRQDIVVIVGRPSQTIPSKETPEEKEQMETWQAAARALSLVVFEGLTVDQAFSGLKQLKTPIGKLYIISHGDVSGIGEISPQGNSVSTTVQDLTERIKKTTGRLGDRGPISVEMLSCFGGGSPKTMGSIGEALGASKVRAPVQITVISGRIIRINGKRLTAKDLQKSTQDQLAEYIQNADILKYYDFVPGVPHPGSPISKEEKLKALVGVLRRIGLIPFISFNQEPGKRHAVPYWKATIEKRKKTEEMSAEDFLSSSGLIEVDIQEPEKNP